MNVGVPYTEALGNYVAGGAAKSDPPPIDVDGLLAEFHPDHRVDAKATLQVGPNRGDVCQAEVSALLQANGLIDDADLAGSESLESDVVVVGGGGAGAAAALAAARAGARVMLATKLRLGDSNTIMAEGGMQSSVAPNDSPQLHFDDTMRGGHEVSDPTLVKQMVLDGPAIVRWLIELGVRFDMDSDHPFGDLILKRPGGASAPRIVAHGDTTGLEIMRVLREEVAADPMIDVRPNGPVIELMSDGTGRCVGVVIYDIASRRLVLVRAKAVVLATGGSGRMHLNGFLTSNHFGATGDGLVLAYRLGARLRDLDSFQYHPTGLAHPPHLAGSLITEAVRSAGAHLRNGLGERFVDELDSRDVVAAAIIRECRAGRGIERDGQVGVWLDTPRLEREHPGSLARFTALQHLASKCGLDPAEHAFLVSPTLHYQNGGVVIDGDGRTDVDGLYCVGELAGGIHGRNRLMGNALLDILSFGRRAGSHAARHVHSGHHERAGIAHLLDWQRKLTEAGLPLDVRSPELYPSYANFDLATHRSEVPK